MNESDDNTVERVVSSCDCSSGNSQTGGFGIEYPNMMWASCCNQNGLHMGFIFGGTRFTCEWDFGNGQVEEQIGVYLKIPESEAEFSQALDNGYCRSTSCVGSEGKSNFGPSGQVPSSSANFCRNECGRDPNCRAVTFDPRKQICEFMCLEASNLCNKNTDRSACSVFDTTDRRDSQSKCFFKPTPKGDMFVDIEVDVQEAGNFQIQLEAALIPDNTGIADDGFEILLQQQGQDQFVNILQGLGCEKDSCTGFDRKDGGANLNFMLTDCNCDSGPVIVNLDAGVQTIRVQNKFRGSAVRSVVLTPQDTVICTYSGALRNQELTGFADNITTAFTSLRAAQARCSQLNSCTGVVSNSDGSSFTLRSNSNLQFSSDGEVAFVKENCN